MKAAMTLKQLKAAIGTEIGCSEWRTITQEMINQFADATDDHQFIHVDPERAAKEAPFGGTIAHGFLTISLLSTLAYEALPMIEGATMGINYGFDKVRFMSPVVTGKRVRARFKLADADIRPSGRVLNNYEVTLEIENTLKPALVANWLTLAILAQPPEMD
ncbi:MaoC family dehydratase [Phyllobacterium endophyticum]|uniref:Nodulation protein NodN n=1 Tax=Phyllobacterium endophyticum TaxID=1149773 RepID=A0A2P7AL49_9HYPH|nr:MaoC family dehydratase [Phyllobacterium endophyticum]MBB3233186.1 acyl dehydratase [Phyllobacterium endophyticum]PSH54916.1 nodulation protein NodN [Phyllobacterium endophyticum]TYR43207.1 MaoC family dehydratase [Phyllobacterium endophyticum]